MLKKILLVALLTLSIVSLSCSSDSDSKTAIRKPEGWIDANTYRAVGRGVPSRHTKDPFERKILSKEEALLNAKEKMISHLINSYMNTLSKSEKELIVEEVIRERISTRMRSGVIVETDWDGNENCMLTYEVSSKNLRSQVDEILMLYTNEAKSKSTL